MHVKITNWRFVNCRRLQVTPQFRNDIHLDGQVYDHPEHGDGVTHFTHRIIDFDGRYCCTENGIHYELGEPLPAYESEYPRARNELHARFKKSA